MNSDFRHDFDDDANHAPSGVMIGFAIVALSGGMTGFFMGLLVAWWSQ